MILPELLKNRICFPAGTNGRRLCGDKLILRILNRNSSSQTRRERADSARAHRIYSAVRWSATLQHTSHRCVCNIIIANIIVHNKHFWFGRWDNSIRRPHDPHPYAQFIPIPIMPVPPVRMPANAVCIVYVLLVELKTTLSTMMRIQWEMCVHACVCVFGCVGR